jgi:hypothetical protein
MQDERLINGSYVIEIGRNHVQVALPRADSNRDIDDFSVV